MTESREARATDGIRRIDHVAILVDDIESALRFWRDGLNLRLSHVEDVPDQEAVVAFLPAGEAEIELVKPTAEESGVARYLAKRGPGLHHLCLEVDDLEATLKRLSKLGIRLVNPEPVIGTAGKRIAFIHPESTHGVLVELYETTQLETEIRLARAHTLSDRVLEQGQVMVAGVLGFMRGLRAQADNGGNGSPSLN